MTRLGVRNLSKPGDMGGQLRSLASHEMLVRVGQCLAPPNGCECPVHLHCTLYTSGQAVTVHLYTLCTHLANYGLLPGVTDLGTAQSGSGTRQDNISHRLRVVT